MVYKIICHLFGQYTIDSLLKSFKGVVKRFFEVIFLFKDFKSFFFDTSITFRMVLNLFKKVKENF